MKKKMTNYNHISKEQRDIIQYMLDKGYSFTDIGKTINKDRTSIAKEVKRNSYVKSLTTTTPFDKTTKLNTIKYCDKLSKPPYVCNTCKAKTGCRKNKIYYHSHLAHRQYKSLLISSRQGIDINPSVIDEIEQSIIPLIKLKKQSVNQVYINHSDILYFSKPTFYKYVNLGVLSLTNLDLPKKIKYKERKKDEEKENKREIAILKRRKYDDYLSFVSKHNKMNICQMDTVEGKQESTKCLLTIIDVNTHFMFIRLLDKKDIKAVNCAWDTFKNSLDTKEYSKLFKIVLTDNGSEFFDPMHIETDYNTGKKLSNVFYCKPYSSWQKGCIEKNHEFIRKVFPKGTSFDDFDEFIIKKLEDNINNTPRESLNGKTPYQLFNQKYPSLTNKLNCSFINPDDVTFNERDYK